MDDVGRALATLDPETASRAQYVVEALFGVEEERVSVAELSRVEVLDFVWSRLPRKYAEGRELHELVWALGDVLAALGREKDGAACRDAHTHQILAAWQQDYDEGARLASEALEGSGLLPPDTPLLEFGEVMGGDELRAYDEVASVIETALDAGALDLASTTFEADRARLVEQHLVAPRSSGSLLDVVRRERAMSWAMGFRTDPRWVGDALPVLEAASDVPDNVELSLAPARALLEAVGDGLTLTGAGYLPTAVAIGLNDTFRWTDVVGSTPKKEADVPPLRFLREHLVAQRLLTVRQGRVTVSAKGRACLNDPALFWSAVTDLSPRWSDFEQEVIAVSAVLLVGSPEVARLSEEVAARIAGRWRGAGNLEREVNWVYIDWHRVGLALGWWDARRGRWLDRLSPRGVGAAARAFWSVAALPGR